MKNGIPPKIMTIKPNLSLKMSYNSEKFRKRGRKSNWCYSSVLADFRRMLTIRGSYACMRVDQQDLGLGFLGKEPT